MNDETNHPMERDPLIERVRAALRAAPEGESYQPAVARVLSVAFASPHRSVFRRALDAWRTPAFTRLGAVAVAGAALVLGFVTRGAYVAGPETEPMTSSGSPTGEFPVVRASDIPSDERLIPTQFILDDHKAASVSIVGEFNQWKVGATPLTRLANGVWTATVPLSAGRHVYAFVLDDTLMVADPRAPKAGDADYGREGSVVMVFAP